ncbi:hypothetical protein QBC43DRAFT_88883 [Cladorrhinum sp. PSN259]|nr:hypothetical protein QBC43DRAFT_88883 [Cladorrhinum sp. PSN259]
MGKTTANMIPLIFLIFIVMDWARGLDWGPVFDFLVFIFLWHGNLFLSTHLTYPFIHGKHKQRGLKRIDRQVVTY